MILSFAALAASPHASLEQIVSANGYGAVVWEGDRLVDAWPRLYGLYDEEDEDTEDILYDAYPGVTDYDGEGGWFNDPDTVEIFDGTNIIVSSYRWGDLSVTQYAFAPMELGYFGVAQVYVLRNASATEPSPAFQFVALHNWTPGSGETVASDSPERVSEEGDDYAVFYRAPGADDVSCEQGYDQVAAGMRLIGDCGDYGSDNVPVFAWNVTSLSPGEERWFGALVGIDVDLEWMDDRPAEEWLLDEVAWWAEAQALSPPPADLDANEAWIWRQQLAWLLMGQVREEGEAYGQIPASLPAWGPTADWQYHWNLSWVRHTALAASALSRVGRADLAAEALRFSFQEGKSGLFSSYVRDVAYGVSLCRNYGDGGEWSDDDGSGINVELDNFGMFLAALDDTVVASEDSTLLDELGLRALDEVADPLANLVDDNGMLIPDSSIWERHGDQKQYAWSSAWAVTGLRAAADLAERLGDDRADNYRLVADGLAAAMPGLLVDADGVVAGSVEELEAGSGYLDGQAAELWNQGILDPRGPELDATLSMWDSWLRVGNGNGYMRNDDALSSYDQQQWPFVDLRISMALRRGCRLEEADALLDHVTSQALLNHGVIPELYTADLDDYAGPAPMLGYGAAAWLLAVGERAELDAACAGVDTDPPDTGPEDSVGEPDTGKPPDDRCGCGGGATAMGPLLGAMAALRARRARRS